MARFRDHHIILADMRRCDGHYGRVTRYRKGPPGTQLHMWSNGEYEGTDDYTTLKEAEDSFRHDGPCIGKEPCRFTRTVAAKSFKADNADTLFLPSCKRHGCPGCPVCTEA